MNPYSRFLLSLLFSCFIAIVCTTTVVHSSVEIQQQVSLPAVLDKSTCPFSRKEYRQQGLYETQSISSKERSINYYVNGARFYDGPCSKLELQAALLSEHVYNTTMQMPCDIAMWRIVPNPTPSEQVGFYLNEIDQTIAVVFKGTSSISDMSTNMDYNETTFYHDGYPNVGWVHNGFRNEYWTLRESVLQFVNRYPNSRILITGHSKGAAVSNLCTFDLSYRFGMGNRIDHLSFASPRVGNKAYCDVMNQLVPSNTRFVTSYSCLASDCLYIDFIASVPPEMWSYDHNGKAKYLNLNSFTMPYLEMHQISTYIQLVKTRVKDYDRISITIPKWIRDDVVTASIFVCPRGDVVRATLISPSLSVWSSYEYVDMTSASWRMNSYKSSNDYYISVSVRGYLFQTAPFSYQSPCPLNSMSCVGGVATKCKDGYYGYDCTLICPGKCHSCSMTGTCLSCKAGWTDTGSNCITPLCDYCAGTNQICVAPSTCACQIGWNGTKCDQPICPVNCKTCVTPNVCSSCISGKFGLDCQYDCISNCDTCSNAQTCTKCNPEWTGSMCATRVPRTIYLGGYPTPRGTSALRTFSSVYSYSLYLISLTGEDESLVCVLTGENGLYTTIGGPSLTSLFPSAKDYVYYYSPSDIITGGSIKGTSATAGGYASTTFVPITQFKNITSGRIGYESSFIINNHTLYGLGRDRYGTMGLGMLTTVTTYTSILSNVVSCDGRPILGEYHTICIMTNNDIYGYGFIQRGYYGMTSSSPQYLPVKLDKGPYMSNAKLIQVVVSPTYSLFLDNNGTVYMSGKYGPNFESTDWYPRILNPTLWGGERIVRMSYSTNAFVLTTHTGRGVSFGTSNSRFTQPITSTSVPGEFFMTYQALYMLQKRTCSGLMDIDPFVCSGRGECTEENVCACQEPWAGKNCDEFTCFGIASRNRSVCSQHGTCVDFDICDCDDGYYGPQCTPLCPMNCANCSTPFLCTKCVDGYYGLDKTCLLSCPPNCDKCHSETGLCERCAPGWYGDHCTNIICPQNCSHCTSPSMCLECPNGIFGALCEERCPSNCNSCISSDYCLECKEGWYGATCEELICKSQCTSCSSPTNCTSCISGFYGNSCEGKCIPGCDVCSSDTECLVCSYGRMGQYCEDVDPRSCGFQPLSETPELISVSYASSALSMYISIPLSISMSNVTTYMGSSEFTNCSTLSQTSVQYELHTDTCNTYGVLRRNISDILSDPTTETALDASGLFWTATFSVNVAFVVDASRNHGVCLIKNYRILQSIELVLEGDSHTFISIDYSDLGIILRQEVISVRNSRLYIKFSLLVEQGMMIRGITSLPSAEPLFQISQLPSSANEYTYEVLSTFISSDYTNEYWFRVGFSDWNSEEVFVDIPLRIRYQLPVQPPTIFEGLSTISYFLNQDSSKDSVFATAQKPSLVVSVYSLNGISLPETLRISMNNAYLCCMNQSDARMPFYEPSNGLLGCTVRNDSMIVWEQLVSDTVLSKGAFGPERLTFEDNSKTGISFRLMALSPYITLGSSLTCYVHVQSKLSKVNPARKVSDATGSDPSIFHSYRMVYIKNDGTGGGNGGQSKIAQSKKTVGIVLGVVFGSLVSLVCVVATLALIIVLLFFVRRRAVKEMEEPSATHLRDFVGILPTNGGQEYIGEKISDEGIQIPNSHALTTSN